METNPIHVCELLVGLGDVNVLGVDDAVDEPIRIYVETRVPRPDCERCETSAVVKDRSVVELVDLPALGRPARLVAQAPLGMFRRNMSDEDVDRAGTTYRCSPSGVDGPGRSVGDVPGR